MPINYTKDVMNNSDNDIQLFTITTKQYYIPLLFIILFYIFIVTWATYRNYILFSQFFISSHENILITAIFLLFAPRVVSYHIKEEYSIQFEELNSIVEICWEIELILGFVRIFIIVIYRSFIWKCNLRHLNLLPFYMEIILNYIND